jgi:hypothetical protein
MSLDKICECTTIGWAASFGIYRVMKAMTRGVGISCCCTSFTATGSALTKVLAAGIISDWHRKRCTTDSSILEEA